MSTGETPVGYLVGRSPPVLEKADGLLEIKIGLQMLFFLQHLQLQSELKHYFAC